MEKIDSKDNSLIKEIKKLKEKKGREIQGRFIVEGIRFLIEAIKSSFPLLYIFISEEKKDKILESNILNSKKEGTKVIVLSKKAFDEIKGTENSQGIIGVVSISNNIIEEKDGFYILCDKVQDPGNLGTIIRLSHAFSSLGVIITNETVDPYNEKTLRSTMGSIFKVPIIKDEDLSYVNSLKKGGYALIGSSLEGSSSLDKTIIPKKCIIALGNEGKGISEEILKKSDILIKINMIGDAESLNVSTAGAIIVYEYAKQNIY